MKDLLYIKVEPYKPAKDIKNDKKKAPENRMSFQEEMAKAVAKEKQKK